MIPVDDRALLLGDGLFETLLALDGALVDFEPHMDRMAAGCAVLGLPPPDRETARRTMQAALGKAGLMNCRAAVRLTYTAGSGGRGLDRPETPVPRLLASASASAAPITPARLITASLRRNAGSPTSRLKTLSYLDNVLARREAISRGADEAVMLNTEGHVACGAAANVFWVRDGQVFTPALACGVLDGTLRRAVMARVPVTEVAQGPEALEAAEAIFLTNSLIGVRPAASLDGRSLAGSPQVTELAEAFR